MPDLCALAINLMPEGQACVHHGLPPSAVPGVPLFHPLKSPMSGLGESWGSSAYLHSQSDLVPAVLVSRLSCLLLPPTPLHGYPEPPFWLSHLAAVCIPYGGLCGFPSLSPGFMWLLASFFPTAVFVGLRRKQSVQSYRLDQESWAWGGLLID